MRSLLGSVLVAALAGCAVYYGQRLDEQFGPADPARYDRPLPDDESLSYWRDVRPVLDNRCVVCHGCNDAPCQSNLASYQGVTRGAAKEAVYATRLLAGEPSRMFIDAQSNAAWRGKGFYPTLNERAMTPEANREASVLHRLLGMKRAHPSPAGGVLPKDRFDFSLDRAQQCPAVEAMDHFERQFPDWGMPFGLPGLSDREHGILTRWIEAGAPYRDSPPLPSAHLQRIAEWESFLNGDGLKTQLMSRYIYEHWFVGHLYFDDLPGNEYFQLVRSRTAPGRPVELVATRRPYDDPGVARVYYRLQRVVETPLAKTLMPYALNAKRMARLKAWFLDAPYAVDLLPSYEAASASNPFVTFEKLPVTARYRFMLEESQFTIMGFIKGPVCRGQVALNVINDHFWVVFDRPDAGQDERYAAFLSRVGRNLQMPAEHESTTGLLRWTRYAGLESDYLKAKNQYFRERFGPANPVTLKDLWDGDGANPNAALTVFRHFDSASVVQGLVGERPQTAWVIGYPLLERIHYLLVAGFDVYGNAGHQLATRLYMDFLRMEGEMNFLGLLPLASRQPVRDFWYRNARDQHIQFLQDARAYLPGESGVEYKTRDSLTELYGMLKAHVARVASPRHDIASSGLTGAPLRHIGELSGVIGRAVSHLPETAFLTVRAEGREYQFTMLSNSAHSNVTELLQESKRRLPDEDTLLVLSGFIGSYPNAFFIVEGGDLPAFVDGVRRLASETDYQKLLARYGIRRTDARFWAHSDALADAYRRWAPKEAGLFDYSRFENR